MDGRAISHSSAIIALDKIEQGKCAVANKEVSNELCVPVGNPCCFLCSEWSHTASPAPAPPSGVLAGLSSQPGLFTKEGGKEPGEGLTVSDKP